MTEQFDPYRSRTTELVTDMVRLFNYGYDAQQTEAWQAKRREYLRQLVINNFEMIGIMPNLDHPIG